jgi:large subunit ribosomal protein L32
MAHQREKSRKQEDKRRTHYKATVAQIATCLITGEAHLYHRAYGMRENVLQRSCYR